MNPALNQIPLRIIKEQALVIGPLAWKEAGKVQGLTVIAATSQVSFSGDPKETIGRLVAQYERLFGRASREVCKDAVKDLLAELPKEDIPLALQ